MENLDTVVHVGSGEGKRLAQILFFEVGIILEEFLAVRIAGDNVQNVFDGDAQTANTGFAAHLARFDGDAVERGLESHDSIVALQ